MRPLLNGAKIWLMMMFLFKSHNLCLLAVMTSKRQSFCHSRDEETLASAVSNNKPDTAWSFASNALRGFYPQLTLPVAIAQDFVEPCM